MNRRTIAILTLMALCGGICKTNASYVYQRKRFPMRGLRKNWRWLAPPIAASAVLIYLLRKRLKHTITLSFGVDGIIAQGGKLIPWKNVKIVCSDKFRRIEYAHKATFDSPLFSNDIFKWKDGTVFYVGSGAGLSRYRSPFSYEEVKELVEAFRSGNALRISQLSKQYAQTKDARVSSKDVSIIMRTSSTFKEAVLSNFDLIMGAVPIITWLPIVRMVLESMFKQREQSVAISSYDIVFSETIPGEPYRESRTSISFDDLTGFIIIDDDRYGRGLVINYSDDTGGQSRVIWERNLPADSRMTLDMIQKELSKKYHQGKARKYRYPLES